METLMDLYNSVESSLDDIDIIKKCNPKATLIFPSIPPKTG